MSVSTFVETPLHVVLVGILSLAHLNFSGPFDICEPCNVHLRFPFIQVSVSKLVSSFFDTVLSPVFLSSSPVSSTELLSEIGVSSEIPVALSSRHSSAESPSVDSKSIAPPCLWVAGSLNSPSLSSSSSFNSSNFSGPFDSSDSPDNFLAFPGHSFCSCSFFESVLVSISDSDSLATSHDPTPSPSPDPSACLDSGVPLIPISVSDSSAANHSPAPSPTP